MGAKVCLPLKSNGSWSCGRSFFVEPSSEEGEADNLELEQPASTDCSIRVEQRASGNCTSRRSTCPTGGLIICHPRYTALVVLHLDGIPCLPALRLRGKGIHSVFQKPYGRPLSLLCLLLRSIQPLQSFRRQAPAVASSKQSKTRTIPTTPVLWGAVVPIRQRKALPETPILWSFVFQSGASMVVVPFGVVPTTSIGILMKLPRNLPFLE